MWSRWALERRRLEREVRQSLDVEGGQLNWTGGSLKIRSLGKAVV